jgi:hypothetical protein
MKAAISAMTLVSLLTAAHPACCEATDAEELAGVWVYSATEGYSGTQECPDFITFSSSHTYQVENECAGIDPARPVVETGTWSVVGQPGAATFLEFRDRKLASDHDFLGDNKSPRTKLLGVNGATLRLEICGASPGTDPPCRIETYRRWER